MGSGISADFYTIEPWHFSDSGHGYRARERWRKFSLYIICITGYGITPAWVVARISELNVVPPSYWIKNAIISLGPAFIQELIGWFIVIYLAIYQGQRIFLRFHIPLSPARLTLYGMLFLGGLRLSC